MVRLTMKQNKPLLARSAVILICVAACGFSLWMFRVQFLPIPRVCIPDGELVKSSDVGPIGEHILTVGHVGGEARSIFIRGNHAFAKLGLELAEFDITNPAQIKRIGYLLIPGDLIYVDEEQQYAFILYMGLWRVDISDPDRMVAEHLSNPRYSITSIKIANENAYFTTRDCSYFEIGALVRIKIWCKNSLHIVNTSTPEGSARCYGGFLGNAIGTIKTGASPELVDPPISVQSGNLTYSVSRDGGLQIFDNSIPSKPVQIGSYSPPFELVDVFAYKSNVFVTTASIGYGLQAIDISNPANPTYAGTLPYYPMLLTTVDNLAFVKNIPPDDVEFFDMQAPSSVNKAGSFPELADIQNMAVVGDLGFAALNGNKLRIIDLSNVSQPVTLGEYLLGSSEEVITGIVVEDHFVYVVVPYKGLRIWDISDLSRPVLAGRYDMPWTIPVGLVLKNNVVYIAAGESAKPDKLEIIDVSEPQNPSLIGTYEAVSMITEMSIVGNFIFLTDGVEGLQVIDISKPASPLLVGSYKTGGFVSGVQVECPYIYLTDMESGFFVLQTDLLSSENCK
jgi:hypothetical protein